MLTTCIRPVTMLIALLAFGLACGSDSTGPNQNNQSTIQFPDWPQTVIAAFCVRGTAAVGDTRTGTISTLDCDAADVDPSDAGYYEIWRIRVSSSRTVTFDASSTFDNYLTVLRVNSVSSTNVSATVVGENDDRSATDLNALVSVQLEPNVDYVVAIAGYDYNETGSYTLRIQ